MGKYGNIHGEGEGQKQQQEREGKGILAGGGPANDERRSLLVTQPWSKAAQTSCSFLGEWLSVLGNLG